MIESKVEISEIEKENRQLRKALEELLTEFENGGPPDVEKVRKKMPESQSAKNPIRTPWEREGYESKETWLDDR